MAISQIGTASISGLGYGFKNRIINGAMAIDQRNAGGAVTPISASITYCLDRWYTAIGSATSGTLVVQRQATGLPGNSQYCIRLARTSGTYAGTIYVGQTIETCNCYDLAGKTITVSFQARAGSAYSASTVGVNCYTGTAADQGSAGGVAGSWTGWANAGTASFIPTTSFATYSATFSIGASVQEIQINLTTGAFSGSGSSNDYVEITNVQLEAGTVATTFDYRPYGTELQLCQRYYQELGATLYTYFGGSGTLYVGGIQSFLVSMRTSPSYSTSSISYYASVVSAMTPTTYNGLVYATTTVTGAGYGGFYGTVKASAEL